mgnify:CR=1 FL=1
MSNLDIKFKRLTPFKRCVLQNFPFIEADFDALTNYGLLCKIVEYLNRVIASQNEVQGVTEEIVAAFNNLYDYVHDYFENLDVQEEINNKLDEMAEDGILADIISQYLNSTAIFGYDTLADMKSADNLTNGSFARTLGYYAKNDGGGATYKIRNITNDDVVDEAFIVEMGDGSNQLIAELVIENDEANVKQCGAYGDGTHDDYQAFNKACQHSKNVLIPSGTYKLNTTVTLTHNTNIYGKTAIVCWSGNTGNADKTEIVTTDVYAFTCSWGNVNNFENITFNGKGINQPCGARINKCEFKGEQGLNNVRVSTVSECSFHNCSVAGIVKLTDSYIQNCFFYNNEIAIDMEDSGDNTIIGNKIEWNTLGIKMHDTVYAVIANNTFDRQTTYAISGTNVTHININGNNFERNLTMHILLSGSYITISNNGMFSKNSEDDQSGTVLPTVAMYLKSISNSLVKGNNVYLPAGDNTSKLFNAYPDYVSNVSIEGNILNGRNTDKFSVSMGTLTSSTTDSVNLAYDFTNVDYLGMTPWTVRLVLPRLVNNNITRSFTNKLFARITPNSAKIQYTLDPDDASREYTCYADLEITNKYAITI